MTEKPDPEINHELIQLLCLAAGRIMEDTSIDLALSLPDQPALVTKRVAELNHAATQIAAMADAACALIRGHSTARE